LTEELPSLPALKSLDDLANVRPTIVVDTREQTPLAFSRLPSVVGTLTSGDYSFQGGQELLAIERKSIQDLVAGCVGDNRDRFERELHRLRGFRFARLVICGYESEVRTGRYRGGISPKAVLTTVAAFEARYNVPVVWAGTPQHAAESVERWVWWFAREIVKQANCLLKAAEDVE